MTGDTFFDAADDREEMAGALRERLGNLQGHILWLKRPSRIAADDRLKLDELEARRDELEDLIRRVCGECGECD